MHYENRVMILYFFVIREYDYILSVSHNSGTSQYDYIVVQVIVPEHHNVLQGCKVV